jgi:hypothetical protein
MSDTVGAAACAGCGLVIAGGTEGCQVLFNEQTALHFGDVQYFAIHRLFVDAYSLQHDPYIESFKSFAAHFAHLCWSLEHDGSRAVPSEAIRAWVERNPGLTKPPLPRKRGVVTIAHVAAAASAAAHRMAVDLWAKSVWEAYAPLQPLAREWVKAALDEKFIGRHH